MPDAYDSRQHRARQAKYDQYRKTGVPPHQRFGKAVEFVRFDLHTKLWGKQAEILRLLKHSKRTAVRSCNGSGKTFVGAAAVIWWLMAHEHKSALAITTAPTQRQVTNLLWREIRSIVYCNPHILTPTTGGIAPSLLREGSREGRLQLATKSSDDARSLTPTPGANETGDAGPIANNFTPRLTKTSLELSPNHYALGLSTDSPERFQGFHEENILFIVDEASGVHEDVYEAIEGSMTSRRARLLLIGNPTSVSGTFYKAFHQNRTQYKKIHISAFDTPNLNRSTAHASRAQSSESRDLGQGRESSPSQIGRELEGGSERSTEHSEPASTTRTRIPNPANNGTYHEALDNSLPPQQIGSLAIPAPCHPSFGRDRGRVDCSGDQVTTVTPGAKRQPEIPGIIKPAWVHDAELTWGKNSTQYQVRVLGEFPVNADDTLIPLTQIEHAVHQKSDPTPAHRARHNAPNAQFSSHNDQHCHPEPDSGSIPRAHNSDPANNQVLPRIGGARGGDSRPSRPTTLRANAKSPLPEGEGLGEGERQRSAANNPDAVESAPPSQAGRELEGGSMQRDLTAPIHIGVDVARFGTDRTVICIRQGNHVLALNQHQKLNTMRTTGLVVNAIQKYNPHTVKIDEIGIGAGVLDRLHELGYNDPTGRSVLPRTGGARGGDMRRATKSSDDARSNERGDSEPSRPTTTATNAKTVVHGVNVGTKATDPEHFFNLRSELYDNLRARFEEQTIVIPNDDDLIGQLAAIRVQYTSRGQLKVEPKETMRRRSLPSPDKADALLLAFAPTPERPPFEVWV